MTNAGLALLVIAAGAGGWFLRMAYARLAGIGTALAESEDG